MSYDRKASFEVLELPSCATEKEILAKYRELALQWYPERHHNKSYAIDQFRKFNEAVIILLSPHKKLDEPLNLLDMYTIFQNIFFGGNDSADSSYEYDGDDLSSLPTLDGSIDERDAVEANEIASKLILEEEEEKLKAERKKAKKKRRKERKKQQKGEEEKAPKQNSTKKQTPTSKDLKEKQKETKEKNISDSEEAIDPDSAFVAVIAKKQKKLKATDSKLENSINTLLPPQIKEDHQSVVLRSRQLALRANEMASLGHFPEAIELFSESIKLDPSDHRFYGNRSYCYDRLNQFEKALKDAEKSIMLCPTWPKGHYRKGRALLGLKKYAESEGCFIQVLKLDNDCVDAISELHNVKVIQIMEMGYSRDQAETALAKHSSVQESIESLLSSQFTKAAKVTEEVEVFVSDDESEVFWKQPPTLNPSKPSFQYDIKMDPKNPENHNSLWIGNVQADVNEKKISALFGKYGELLSVKVMPEKFCAFVNYKNSSSPGKAMQALQGLDLYGANIVIRFPNLPGETITKKKTVGAVSEALKIKGTEECYFWRTTGCIYGENCRNLHVKEHKGIDKKKWHKPS